MGDKDAAEENQSLAVGGWLAGDPVVARSYAPGNSQDAVSTTGYSVNTWHHGCAVFTSNILRAAFIDGGSKGTDVDQVDIGVTYDRVSVGRSGDSTPSWYMSGRIAEAAIWNGIRRCNCWSEI